MRVKEPIFIEKGWETRLINQADRFDISTEPVRVLPASNRHKLAYIYNEGPTDVRLGSHQVQIDTGIPLAVGQMFTFDTEAELDQDWHAISHGETRVTVSVIE